MLKTHIASVCFTCFGCFRGMLQLFYTNVAKVDQNVAYVAMVVHICCKGLFPMFHLCFWTYVISVFYLDVAYVSHICCKCFIWILHIFTMIFKCFSYVFASVSKACFKCFICLHTYVASECFKNRSVVVVPVLELLV